MFCLDVHILKILYLDWYNIDVIYNVRLLKQKWLNNFWVLYVIIALSVDMTCVWCIWVKEGVKAYVVAGEI